ncbi:thioredoxin fold domain-containing protein [Pseudomonas coronafaciens]|uniref:thioredoxin fold domain-containing protein n=1 Tax=Pseudomonas coronafaciens TaxID=53409 RepID=UPI000E3C02CC|nr:thioredoxin fold domain-containing protein [Pseudomonas coronafaciens]
MASAPLRAPFSVNIQGNQLVVFQAAGTVTRTICTLDLRHQHSFYLSHDGVVCRDVQGFEFSLETHDSDETHDLLIALSHALLRHERRKTQRRLMGVFVLLVVLCLAASWLERAHEWPVAMPAAQVITPSVPSAPKPDLAKRSAPAPIASELRQSAADVAPDDRWTLPQEVRATLPQKLHNAAERKLFTVDYSSGHARTLYVFSDPGCPNCQRLESALNTLSDAFNVVVFPVPVIGKEKSIAAITPVLCLPPEQRKAAWDGLFDPVPEGVKLGKAQEKQEEQASAGMDSNTAKQPDCDVAVKALGINQTAYQAYRIPGTPWVISDDGRYVPQRLLRDPIRLKAFLDEQPARQLQGVSNAAQ